VEELPEDASGHILMISTRHFEPKKSYALKEGVYSKFRLYYFVAAYRDDTAFVMSIQERQGTPGICPAKMTS
jgi:hypothetical protein